MGKHRRHSFTHETVNSLYKSQNVFLAQGFKPTTFRLTLRHLHFATLCYWNHPFAPFLMGVGRGT